MGVNAATRRAFVITGKDAGSPFLWWLAQGRQGGEQEFALAAERLSIDDTVPGAGYLGWYRALNYDYPFLDYAAEEGRATDIRLMDAYAGSSPPPAWATERTGVPRPLTMAGTEAPSDGERLEPCESLLAAWLRIAAGYKATSPGRMGAIHHRTSPSGGARHPTDVGVGAGEGWGDLAGSWWYHPVDHALVAGAQPLTLLGGSPRRVIFSITSHVGRAMWRYRDVRAFRPVLYDVGHVVETLIATVQLTGWSARWVPRAMFTPTAAGLDLTLGVVVAEPDGGETLGDPLVRRASATPTGELRTNPFLSLTSDPEGLTAVNHLRAREPLRVLPAMVDALAYATPSSRRDRPSDVASIVENVHATAAEIGVLTDAGLLLDAAEGDPLWTGLEPWSTHDWYLSALLHAEAAARPTRVTDAPLTSAHADLPAALDHRRTCRTVRARALPQTQIMQLLEVLRAQSEITIVISCARGTDELPVGVHEIAHGALSTVSNEPLAEGDIMRAAIGQPWARGFSYVIWLLPSGDEAEASAWEAQLIECGRLAQRIALAVSGDPCVGVFQSPAMIDAKLAALLPSYAIRDGGYLIGLGMADGASDHRAHNFLVQDILRCQRA